MAGVAGQMTGGWWVKQHSLHAGVGVAAVCLTRSLQPDWPVRQAQLLRGASSAVLPPAAAAAAAIIKPPPSGHAQHLLGVGDVDVAAALAVSLALHP